MFENSEPLAVRWDPNAGTLAPAAARTIHQLQNALQNSEFLTALRALRQRSSNAICLSTEQHDKLKTQRCWAEDWGRIRVSRDFNPDRLRDVRLFGDCELGSFDSAILHPDTQYPMPTGIYNSTLVNCTVADNAAIYNVGLLANTFVGEESLLSDTHTISCCGESNFGNDVEMAISIEVGGREVHTYAELTVAIAETVAKNRHDAVLLKSYRDFTRQYAKAAAGSQSIVEAHCRVTNCGKLLNVYIGRHSRLDNALLLQNCTVLSGPQEQTTITDGALISDSIIQYGSHVGSGAIVQRSVLCEHSTIERHGKVSQSVIGSNTVIAEGEVTASLVGPFVGFHHQSLLIAAMWPQGKGNVGSGANVGSNHTSKAPDQEIWPGEGVFFGLGVNIKFPTDLTASPYSIVATAVNALPQRVEFPFSLINSPTRNYEGILPGYNELTPAWVLSDDLYSVMRNEHKFRERNRARRTQFEFEVFRPWILDLIRDARVRLQGVGEFKRIYTDRDIGGLGKNFLLEEARIKAVGAYTFYIRFYALRGFYRSIEKRLATRGCCDMTALLAEKVPDSQWAHERDILSQEYPSLSARELLQQFLQHQEKVAEDVQSSKERDDSRGVRIISDYRDAHLPVAHDPFIVQVWKDTESIRVAVEKLMLSL